MTIIDTVADERYRRPRQDRVCLRRPSQRRVARTRSRRRRRAMPSSHPPASSDQRRFQARGDMPAVLDRPHPLLVQAGGEPQRVKRSRVAGRDLALPPQRAGLPIDCDQRVVALVGVCPDHDHVRRPFVVSLTKRTIRRTPLSWGAATLLLGHAGGPRSVTGDTANSRSDPSGRQRQRESARHRPRAKPTGRTTSPIQTQPLTERQRGRQVECGCSAAFEIALAGGQQATDARLWRRAGSETSAGQRLALRWTRYSGRARRRC